MPILKKSNINTNTLMRWAERKLGPSRCKAIIVVDRKTTDMGWWDWQGHIYINIRGIRSMTTVYRILAHEWTHAQQKWSTYKKYAYKYTYRNNPCEIAARKRERTCFKEMFAT